MADKVSTKELGLILGARLMKTEDLHYGYWGPGLEVTLGNLKKAQHAYTEYLIGQIPPGVKTILDVGCGTGHVSEQLRAKGFEVEGVSPSPVLSDMVAKRLGPDYVLHRTTMEGLNLDKKFDMILFSESFQYIPPEISLPMCRDLLKETGHVLISDFFQTDAPGQSAHRGGHRLSEFYPLLATMPFKVLKEEDITEFTAPNMKLEDDVLTDYMQPIWEAVGYYMRRNRPWASGLFMFFFGKKVRKVETKYFTHRRGPENFKTFKSYRMFLLKKLM